MIKVFLSKIYPNYFYLQYSDVVDEVEDKSYIDNFFIPFMKEQKDIHLIMDYTLEPIITDKDFFYTSGLSRYDVNKELTTLVSFGLVGVQKSFIKHYYKCIVYKKVNCLTYDTRDQFEKEYSVSFKETFEEVFSFTSI